MSEIKSHEFDNFVERPLPSQRLYLFYGPDRGLVAERAAAVAGKTGVALDDPFSLIKLDGSDLSPGRLADEANAIGLFGGSKLVWVRASGTEKSLSEGLGYLAEEPPRDAFVIVEAGDLKKGSALRKIGETARSVIAVACYADDVKAINGLIDKELGAAGLRITPTAREALRDLLGADRLASRNEILKLALYCRDEPVIEEHHVLDIIGDASSTSVDDAVDAVLLGDMDRLMQSLRKVEASKTSMFLVLQSCLRQFQQLDVLRAEMDAKRLGPSQVTASLGRGIHFRRKPLIEAALKHWALPVIRRDLQRLQNAIFQSRARQALEADIASQALIAIALQAARQRASG
ncbi:DNA polymerase III subunit delta [Rhizobium sp. Leaf384]|uniref:DNA polymerase III subunit delta n=1 Tax=unclassified Rhizobium TaxID=2613769 RepID=UPI00071426BD|nr:MULTISPECIES: DNA polymerase III subunit delta [unclassified Rhizobium]KQS76114.1 DNA polymerase III subunit delta [Rhizobium sp. Leaf384]KQS85859.1 DNA polymerase III subunit delta [Rhizobium sp. Leaf383]